MLDRGELERPQAPATAAAVEVVAQPDPAPRSVGLDQDQDQVHAPHQQLQLLAAGPPRRLMAAGRVGWSPEAAQMERVCGQPGAEVV